MSLTVASELRARLIEQAAAQLAGDGVARTRVHALLERALAPHDDAELLELARRVAATGEDYGYHPPAALARVIDHALAELVVAPSSRLVGGEHLRDLPQAPLLLANHLSFSDAHLIEYLLARDAHTELAQRLTVLAGPKVYSDPARRLSSLCFGSIKVPQSSDRATDEALLPRREVARLAAVTLDAVSARRAAGDAVLIFVEGTRSRSGAMQAALPAVSRYLEAPGTVIVPLGLSGSEKLVPIGDERAHPSEVMLEVGAPIDTARLFDLAEGKRRVVMDAVGLAIAACLPESYRGAYADDAPDLGAARAVLAGAR